MRFGFSFVSDSNNMERWVGRVAVVTGASSGIGAAIVVDLLKAGVRVVGLARRVERVKELAKLVTPKQAASLHAIKCDVSKEDEIKAAFAWVDKHLGGTDILVNNAGIFRNTKLLEANNAVDIQITLDTNVLGLVLCTREAYQSMKRRSVNDGHVVLINSVTGHSVPIIADTFMNIYPPTKHAVTAIAETLRQEFIAEGTQIKITSISPGIVSTEMIPDAVRQLNLPMLESEDISAAVLYVIGTPPRVQVHELIIKPVGEAF